MRGGGVKNGCAFVLFLLAGVVLGGFLGEYLSKIPYLGWLSFGQSLGLTSPLVLDLGVISVQFALRIRVTIAGILGLLLAVFFYRKI